MFVVCMLGPRGVVLVGVGLVLHRRGVSCVGCFSPGARGESY